MPKLRLRVLSSGDTHKLDIPKGSTWGMLQTEVQKILGLPGGASVVLSLNKKTPLEGAPSDPLAELGICDGDLVWLLAPSLPSSIENSVQASTRVMITGPIGTAPALLPGISSRAAAPAAGPPSAAPTASRPATNGPAQGSPRAIPAASAAGAAALARAAASAGTAADSGAPRSGPMSTGSTGAAVPGGSRAAAADAAGAPGPTAPPGTEGPSGVPGAAPGDPMDTDGAEESEDGVEAGMEAEETAGGAAVWGPPGVSLKLRRLLLGTPETVLGPSAAGVAPGTPQAGGPSHGTASSSPWNTLGPVWRCLLLVDCAMAEAGFVGLQDFPALAATAAAAAPAATFASVASLPKQLRYANNFITSSSCDGGGDQSHHPGRKSGAAAASGDVQMAEASAAATAGGCVSGTGSLADSPAAPAAVAKLLWYTMGKYLVIHGVPCAVAAAAVGSAAAAATTGPPSVTTLTIDLAEYGYGGTPLPLPPATEGAAAKAGPVRNQGLPYDATLLIPANPAAHWRQLKDGLVLPLLATACRTAGVAPPLGLTVLPLELQMAILRRLQARDLARLSCCCTSLHRLASEDELWRPLYEQEFCSGGPIPAGDVTLANIRGYKYMYARRWSERAERRKRRQVFRAMPPSWGPPPMAPMMRPPYIPPGSIGGDYDRLPGPFLGGGFGGFGGGRLPGPFGPIMHGGGPGGMGPMGGGTGAGAGPGRGAFPGPPGGLPSLPDRRPGGGFI